MRDSGISDLFKSLDRLLRHVRVQLQLAQQVVGTDPLAIIGEARIGFDQVAGRTRRIDRTRAGTRDARVRRAGAHDLRAAGRVRQRHRLDAAYPRRRWRARHSGVPARGATDLATPNVKSY